MARIFQIRLDRMQPSQLYISSEKLDQLMASLESKTESIGPIPVKMMGGEVVMMDGHTRALAASLQGLSHVRAYWDEDDLDMEAYGICVEWCKTEGVTSVADLLGRVVSSEDYRRLWLERCREMHRRLRARRRGKGANG